MPTIVLETIITADIKVCFDLSRSIDLHEISTRNTDEKAIAGVTNGLIGFGQSVTWQATHFGIRQKLTSKITELNYPSHFRDEQQIGIFKYFVHDHYFTSTEGGTQMKDVFKFEAPLGILGWIAEKLFLKKYMERLLVNRNKVIKYYSENTEGKKLLHDNIENFKG